MRARYKAVIFLSSLALGILLPVMSLVLCARGCDLKTLGFAFGIFAAAVIIAEVPSGIFADLYGRKTSFLLSCALTVASGAALVLSRGFALSAAGLALAGLGTAFSSGSIQALVIEEAEASHGEERVGKAVAAMSAYECAGYMLGALAGGFLPAENGYLLHLIARMALAAAAGILALLALHEPWREGVERKPLRAHLSDMRKLLAEKRSLLLVIACVAALAFMQFMLETYWQPRFVEISGENAGKLLGMLCALGFGATVLGCAAMGLVKGWGERRYWAAYLAVAVAMAIMLILISLQNRVLGFALGYIALYFMLGLLAVSESTLVNLYATDDVRASMLSLTSFIARAGGVVSSLLGAALLAAFDISGLWRTGAYLTLACAIIVALLRFFPARKASGRARECAGEARADSENGCGAP